MTDMEALHATYIKNAKGAPSKFHVWEYGGAVGDSVTPSTYNSGYRVWLRNLLRKLMDESGTDVPALLSLGCGNATVEAGLVAAGYRVLGLDTLPEAVELAKSKSVHTVCADFFDWTPPPEQWVVVLADGFLEHVFDRTEGLRPALERIYSWMPPRKGTLVISNDGPRAASTTQALH
jgi:SAM-dependent methyltransferase